MKTRVVSELFTHSLLPVALLDNQELQWANTAFKSLSPAIRQQLLHDETNLGQGYDFDRLSAESYCLLIGRPVTPPTQERELIRELIPALAAGGDPWLTTARVLGPLIGEDQLLAVKHRKAGGDDLLGHWQDGNTLAPRQLPTGHGLAEQIYSASDDQLLILKPGNDHPNDPIIGKEQPGYWASQRVDTPAGAQGYLAIFGDNDSAVLAARIRLLQLAADLLSGFLIDAGRETPPENLTNTRQPIDDLTGLPGRAAFDAALEASEKRYLQTEQDCEMAMLDINSLSSINNELGIDYGDQVLRLLADQLKATCRHNDRVFRFGGDEFVLLMPFSEHAPPLSQRLNRIENWLKEETGIAQFSLAAGVSSLSETNGSSDDLMLLCDRRLKESKASQLAE
ncbi:GGDEF domain-containing protein [Marinobacterium sp. YM272]|uniref:GGDEF domain-containing protein n=1 Tax=Marinobacterium sp. YM272 TaxID=3421654 RepID=UPI003D7F253E